MHVMLQLLQQLVAAWDEFTCAGAARLAIFYLFYSVCSCLPRVARPGRRARGGAMKRERWSGGCSASSIRCSVRWGTLPRFISKGFDSNLQKGLLSPNRKRVTFMFASTI